MLYQIQTKYRDEARPRAGLIRVREFTMKDAYSFHASKEDLAEYYRKAHEAYEKIFRRIGLKNFVSIESDTGMMGGAASHEFMAIAECGEDTLFLCAGCGYKANKEVARTGLRFAHDAPAALTKVHTPGQKTIEEVSKFLGVDATRTGKAVFYSDETGRLCFAVIRGDLEVNETKLRNLLKARELKPATDEQIRAAGSVPGFASPLGVNSSKVRIVFDRSAAESSNLVVGANETDYHFTGFCFGREMAGASVEVADIASARDADPCPSCGMPLKAERGIEIGNIFQLGTKYSESMSCTYLDQSGKARPAIMGCYGIGVGRSMAAVIEESHDQYGPIWPLEIAPYQAHLCALNLNEASVREAAEKLYSELLAAGVEVLYDDRNEKAGVAFNDADLIGVPYRIIVSAKTLATGEVELKKRAEKSSERVSVAEALGKVKACLSR